MKVHHLFQLGTREERGTQDEGPLVNQAYQQEGV